MKSLALKYENTNLNSSEAAQNLKIQQLGTVFRTVSAGADKGIADKCFIRQRKPYQFADKYLSAQTKLRNCLMAYLLKLINVIRFC